MSNLFEDKDLFENVFNEKQSNPMEHKLKKEPTRKDLQQYYENLARRDGYHHSIEDVSEFNLSTRFFDSFYEEIWCAAKKKDWLAQKGKKNYLAYQLIRETKLTKEDGTVQHVENNDYMIEDENGECFLIEKKDFERDFVLVEKYYEPVANTFALYSSYHR